MSKLKIALWEDYVKSGAIRDDNLIGNVNVIKEVDMDGSELFDRSIEMDGVLYGCGSYSPKYNMLFVEELEHIDTSNDSLYSYEEITCPQCGTEFSDSFEFGDDGDEECDNCGCQFSYCRNIEVSYSMTVMENAPEPVKVKD